VTVRLIHSFTEVLRVRAEWNRLAERSPSATVFQTFEWLDAWWGVFGVDERLRVVLLFDGAVLVAAAPLMTYDVRAYGRRRIGLTFIGGLQADYADFLYEDAASLRRLLQALRSVVSWDVLDLHRIPADSATVAALALEFPRWRGAVSVSDTCPAYVFDAQHDGHDVLGKKSMRRHISGLHKAGAVDVRHLTEPVEIAHELDDFFQQHVERRSITDVPSNFVDRRARTFYGTLAEALAPQGKVLFTIVALDGKPAAYHFGFVHRQRLVWYKPSFALHLSRLSPGEVLLAELFKYCQAHALAELDFTVGDEAFKSRFCTVKRHNVRFRAFRSGVLQAIDRAQRVLKDRAKRVKAIAAIVRRVRAHG
jgi:CelD/BcsL family acetyltransferase involved in cellulose biosynthesis